MVDRQRPPVGADCFARVCHLHVEVVELGHSTAEATGRVSCYTICVSDATGLGRMESVVLVCPLQRDCGSDRGRQELGGDEDGNIKLLLETADPADGIFVTCKRVCRPTVSNVDHAHPFQQEEAQVMAA